MAAAKLRLSKKVPWFEPPSPVNETPTWSVPRTLADRPTPQTSGGPPPTMPLAPNMPVDRSAMCIDPPLPLQVPVALPYSSAIMATTSQPFAMACPWPRWVLAM